MNVRVLRLFPSYRFALQCDNSPDQCVATLRSHIHGRLPTLGVGRMTDMSLLFGEIGGSQFQAAPVAGVFGGITRPVVRGSITGSEIRSDVIVDVRLAWWVWLLTTLIPIIVLISPSAPGTLVSRKILAAATYTALWFLVTLVTQLVEGRRVRRILEKIFATVL